MGSHLGRVVVEDLLDRVLGDVAVDEPGAQGVAPLMGGEMDGFAVLVADAASLQPCV